MRVIELQLQRGGFNYEKRIKRRIQTRRQQETGDPGQSCTLPEGPSVRHTERKARVLAGRGWTVRV